jgi:dolichyl-diphosphooligosaccharide--protein glycosyltransferase
VTRGLTSMFLQGQPRLRRLLKVVDSRATKVLTSRGFYVRLSLVSRICRVLTSTQEFWNWFDPTVWYPLGRAVGGTIYPGLMATSGVIYNILHALNLPVDVRNVCVMLAPGFSALTAWATYMCVLLGMTIRKPG